MDFWEGRRTYPQKQKLFGGKYLPILLFDKLNTSTWVQCASDLPYLLISNLSHNYVFPFSTYFINQGQKYSNYYSDYMNFLIQRLCDPAEIKLLTQALLTWDVCLQIQKTYLWYIIGNSRYKLIKTRYKKMENCLK